MVKLTTTEAEELIKQLKRCLENEIRFPGKGEKEEVEAIDKDVLIRQNKYKISIYRGKIRKNKYNICGRLSLKGISLLELHITPNGVHRNPDGKRILGNHWHLYTEEHDRNFAFPAKELSDDDFVENTLVFLKRFNVVDLPRISFQPELV